MRKRSTLLFLLAVVVTATTLIAGSVAYAGGIAGVDDPQENIGGGFRPGGSVSVPIPGWQNDGSCDTLDPAWTVVAQNRAMLKYQCRPNTNITNWSFESIGVTGWSDGKNIGQLPAGGSPATGGSTNTLHATWTVSGKIPTTPADFAVASDLSNPTHTGELSGALFLMFFQNSAKQDRRQKTTFTTTCQQYSRNGAQAWFTEDGGQLALEWSVALLPNPDDLNNPLVEIQYGMAQYDPDILLLSSNIADENPSPVAQPNKNGSPCVTSGSGTSTDPYRYAPATVANGGTLVSDPGTVGARWRISGQPNLNVLDLWIPHTFHTFGGPPLYWPSNYKLAEPGDVISGGFPMIQALVTVYETPQINYPEDFPDIPGVVTGGDELVPPSYLKLNPPIEWAPWSAFDPGIFYGSLTIGAETVPTAICPQYTLAPARSTTDPVADNSNQINPLFSRANDPLSGIDHYDSWGAIGGIPAISQYSPNFPIVNQDNMGPKGCDARIPISQSFRGTTSGGGSLTFIA